MAEQLATSISPNYSVLVVDLDGSLAKTDTLWESIILFLKLYPFRFFRLFVWLFKGKAHFKHQLAQKVIPRADLLPYSKSVLDYISYVKSFGIPIILASASNHSVVKSVANHFNLFASSFGSDSRINLSGANKLEAVKNEIADKKFAYIGDSISDIVLWEAAETAVLVDPPYSLLNHIASHPNVIVLNNEKKRWGASVLKCLRAHQWVKNILLFLPSILAHRIFEPAILVSLLVSFFSFSFCASAIYVLNDLLDLESDRQHTYKNNRPMASGMLSIKNALLLFPVLILIALSLSYFFLPLLFFAMLIIYLLLNIIYSYLLKKKIIFDVVFLSSLYTLRLLSGAAAVLVPVSSWLLTFSLFFFISLAFMKRYAEFSTIQDHDQKMKGRGYLSIDADVVLISGVSSAHMSLIILCLFISSESVVSLYSQPVFLWFIVPCLFYWLTRMWMLTHRGKMTNDPIVFTIRDKTSWIIGIITAIIIIAATFWNFGIIPKLDGF